MDRRESTISALEARIAELEKQAHRRRGLPGRRSLVAIVTVPLTTRASGNAFASIPDSGGVIHGCVTKAQINGQAALTLLDTASGKTCSSAQTAITWNQTGPQGPKGDTGPLGPAGPQGPPGPAGAGSVGYAYHSRPVGVNLKGAGGDFPNYATVVSTPDPATDPGQGLPSGTYYVTATIGAGFPFIPSGTMDLACQIHASLGTVVFQGGGFVSRETLAGDTVVATAVVHASDHDQISVNCTESPASAPLGINVDGTLTMMRVDASQEGTNS